MSKVFKYLSLRFVVGDVVSLAVDNVRGKLYSSDGASIKRADLNGSNPEVIVTGGTFLSTPVFVTVFRG